MKSEHGICFMDELQDRFAVCTRLHDEHDLLPPFHNRSVWRNLVRAHSGDFICQETHVPIPNTTVKLTEPTIVP